jgi:exosortase/archaeosortase family protein
LIITPLLRALLLGEFRYAFNVSFYTQEIYLIICLFVFLSYLVFKDRINIKKPDLDNSVVYGIIAICLFLWLATLHVDFDTLLKMDVLDIDDDIQIGFGSIFADNIDVDKIKIDEDGIKKIITKKNTNNDVLLRLHGWKEKDSYTHLTINGNSFEITEKLPNRPGWSEISLPGHAFNKGENTLEFTSDGATYISSQWVYHDAKTLKPDNTYYGQEALVYVAEQPDISPLFKIGFKYKLILRLLAMTLLLLALFGVDWIRSIDREVVYGFAALGITSAFAVNTVFFVQNQWKYLSLTVAKTLYFILSMFSSNVYVNFSDPVGPIIGVGNFIIRVYKNCSGIESFAIFMILFLILVCFNWNGINKFSLPFLFGIGLVGVFLVNIIRLVILILIGAFISRDMAMQFFHTNLGWLLVLGYFLAFNALINRFFVRVSS